MPIPRGHHLYTRGCSRMVSRKRARVLIDGCRTHSPKLNPSGDGQRRPIVKMLGTGLLLPGTVEWKQRYTRGCMLYVRWSCRGVFKFDCLSSSSGAWRLRFSSSLGRICTSGDCCVFPFEEPCMQWVCFVYL